MPRQNRLGRLIAGAVAASFGAAGRPLLPAAVTPVVRQRRRSNSYCRRRLAAPTMCWLASSPTRSAARRSARLSPNTVRGPAPSSGRNSSRTQPRTVTFFWSIRPRLSPSLPHLRKLNFDPLTTLDPICELATFPTVIVVNASSPYHTLADLSGCLTPCAGNRDAGRHRAGISGA